MKKKTCKLREILQHINKGMNCLKNFYLHGFRAETSFYKVDRHFILRRFYQKK